MRMRVARALETRIIQAGTTAFLFLIAGCISQNSRHTGEIDVVKAAHHQSSTDSRLANSIMVLQERGFDGFANGHRFHASLADTDFISPDTLIRHIDLLLNQSRLLQYRYSYDIAVLQSAHNLQEVQTIEGDLVKLRREVDDARRANQTAALQAHRLEQALIDLKLTQEYLEDLSNQIEEIKLARNPDGSFELRDNMIFTINGYPLIPGSDWEKTQVGEAALNANRTSSRQKASDSVVRLNQKAAKEKFSPVMARLTDLHSYLSATHPSHGNRSLRLTADDLQNSIIWITEDCLNVTNALTSGYHNRSSRGILYLGDYYEQEGTINDSATLTRVLAYDFDPGLQRLAIQIGKAQTLIGAMTRELSILRSDLGAPYQPQRQKAEYLSQRLGRFGSHEVSRKLIADNANTSEDITIILKTLYVRALTTFPFSDDIRTADGELLVTAQVTTSSSDAGNKPIAYPVIFEEDFAPSMFVNRYDRVVYGPQPYEGKAIDIRLVIEELDDLDNEAIKQALRSMTVAIGAVNPEFSAAAPAVSSFASALIDNTRENDTELDVSFTIPALEKVNKSDVDFLVAETGHYILIKTENPTRYFLNLESSAKGGRVAASRRQLYRRLVYNPEDGKLYHRRYYGDPKLNFRADNLFLEQTYAVLVVTDEYKQGDDLGDVLRQQLAASLGERRAKTWLPSGEDIQQTIDQYNLATGRELGQFKTNRSREDTQAVVDRLHASLWQNSGTTEKQIAVDTLFAMADGTTRIILGKDIERWKNAKLTLNANKEVVIKSPALQPLTVTVPIAAGATGPTVFPEITTETVANYQYVVVHANPTPIGAFAANVFTPATGNAVVPRVTLQAIANGETTPSMTREVVFVGTPFGLSIGGAAVATPAQMMAATTQPLKVTHRMDNPGAGQTITILFSGTATGESVTGRVVSPAWSDATTTTNAAVAAADGNPATPATPANVTVTLPNPLPTTTEPLKLRLTTSTFTDVEATGATGQYPVVELTITFQ